jgi:PKD repeat protein
MASLIAADSISQVPMIRLKMNGNSNYLDETILYYQEGATAAFDSEYDAYKISGPNNVPSISQEFNSVLMQINGISPVVSSFSINIKTTTHTTGNFTITATDFAQLPAGTCVSLYDQITGSNVNILTNPYTFNLSSSTTSSRFTLVVTHFVLPILTDLKQPHCLNTNAGKFKVEGTSHGPWNYIWKDSLGNNIKTSVNSFNSDSLINVSKGNYHVEITSSSNTCYSNSIDFHIMDVTTPVVMFNAPDTIYASIMQNYATQNQSQNCESYTWTFGNGSGVSNDFEPNHIFTTPGLFETKLIGISSSGCADSIIKTVRVIDLATSLENLPAPVITLLSMGGNTFMLRLNEQMPDEVEIELFNLSGQIVFNEHFQNLRSQRILSLDFRNFPAGMYVVQSISKNQILNHSKILIR